ncbi:Bac_surface_Ag domain-containing protein, partial [Haematococcus lacustris]
MGAADDTRAASAPASSTSSQSESRSEPPRERDYSALYERIKRKPCRVANLEQLHETQGRKLHTRAHLIERELQKVQDASTLEEIHLALEEAGSNLEKLRVFSRIELLVNEEPEDEPEVCSVLVDLEEKNWYRAHLATYVQ